MYGHGEIRVGTRGMPNVMNHRNERKLNRHVAIEFGWKCHAAKIRAIELIINLLTLSLTGDALVSVM